MKNKVLSLLLVFLAALVLVGCSSNNKEESVTYTNPSITDSESVVYTGSYNNKNFSVTKGEVYDQIRYFSGLSLLLEEIDSKILEGKMAEITTTDKFYTSRYNRMVYETSNQAEIDLLSDAEKNKHLEEYNKTLALMGLDATGAENYIKLLAARDKATYEFLEKESTNSKSDYYLSNATLENYYNSSYNTNAKALVINFTNGTDFKNALAKVNLVTYKSELRKYTGTTPIADISRSDLSDDNTEAVADNEVLGLFVSIYNNQNPIKTAITTDSVLTNEEFSFDYDVLSSHAANLASYIFQMDKDEYTYTTYKSSTDYGTEYSLIYKLDEAKKEFADLTEDELSAVKDAYFMAMIENSTYSRAALVELRQDAGVVIFDKYFAYSYATSYDSSMNWKTTSGNDKLIAKADSFEISADDFYNYAMGHNDALYILYASIKGMEESINNFEFLYGAERDVYKNGSLRKIYFYDTLRSAVDTGFSEATYNSEDVYLYARFGFNDFDKALYNYYIQSDLKTVWVSETVLDNNDGVYSFNNSALTYATDVLNDLYTNYYNLYSYQINITTDYNSDYQVDDLTDVYTNAANYGLTIAQADIEAKLASLYTVIADKLNGKKESELAEALSDFVTEYNKNEDGTYDDYKTYGFKVTYQKVTSSSTAITYANYGSTATDEMNQAYKTIYNDKMLADTFSEFAIADAFVADKNGAHLVVATKGTDSLKKPSFKYEIAEGDETKYNAQSANDTDEPSLSQFAAAFNVYYYSLLAADKDEAATYGVDEYPLPFPTSVSFSNYTSKLSSYFYSDNYLYSYAAKALASTTSDATLKAKFEAIQAVYEYFLEESK